MPGYNYAKSPDGLVLLADGLGPVQRWDGLAASLVDAGTPAPAAAPALGGSLPGEIQGSYYAYQRWLTSNGLASNLSPVSNLYVTSLGAVITGATDASPVVVTAASHALATGALVQVVGVKGNTAANGLWRVTRVDANTFSLDSSVGNGAYAGGGNFMVSGVWGRGHRLRQLTDVGGFATNVAEVRVTHHRWRNVAQFCVVGAPPAPLPVTDVSILRLRNTDSAQNYIPGAPLPASFGFWDFLVVDEHALLVREYTGSTGTASQFSQGSDRGFSVGTTNVGNIASVTNATPAVATVNVATADLNDLPFYASASLGAGFGPHRVTVYSLTGANALNGTSYRVDQVLVSGTTRTFTLKGSVASGAGSGGRFVALRVVEDATNSSPITVTSTKHGLTTGTVVRIGRCAGNTAANGCWTITATDTDHFTLDGSVGNGTLTNGGSNTDPPVWTAGYPVHMATFTTPVVVSVLAHGLETGARVLVHGVAGNTNANGEFTVTRVDADRFSLDGSSGNGDYRGGGYFYTQQGGKVFALDAPSTSGSGFTLRVPGHPLGVGTRATVSVAGVGGLVRVTSPNGQHPATGTGADTINVEATVDSSQPADNDWFRPSNYPHMAYFTAEGVGRIDYSSVQAPADARIVRRQLLRNTNGQAATFYVDVDTTDLVSTTFNSTRLDSELSAQEAVPLLDSEGRPYANRNGVPPGHKAALAHHLDRMFAAAEVAVTAGSVMVTSGSTAVTGVGTSWGTGLAGRIFYVVGHTKSYEIASVDAAAQTLTLTAAYAGATDPFAVYSIRPAPAERRLVYFSGAGLPESWNPTDALSIQEDGDEITGLMVKGSFLYVLEKRHVYRFTFQTHPADDGYVFLAANRGCVNHRCAAVVEGNAFLLDEAGVWSFSGGSDATPVGHAVQDVFRPDGSPWRVNWAASDYFHCVHYPPQEVIRWFVALSGHSWPRHALAYNYRQKRWWVEEFAVPVGASACAYQPDPRLYLGAAARKVLGLWRGPLDGPDPEAGTVRGTVTSSTACSLTDANASFPAAGVVGHPVALCGGRGKGQVRLVTEVSGTTLRVDRPWLVRPDVTTVYQLGGVPWKFRSGWFRFQESEENAAARLAVTFEPAASAGTLDLRVYRDHSAAPSTWKLAATAAQHAGVAVTAGGTDLEADLTKASGFVQQRLDRHRELYLDGPRYLSVELGGVKAQDPVKVYRVGVDGASPEGQS